MTTIVNNIVREEYGKFAPPSAPLRMIDAGAYIGDSSAYFASKYPDLKIVALEPHPANYAMAKRNSSPTANASCCSTWRSAPRGKPYDLGEYDTARGGGGAPIEGIRVPDLFQGWGWERLIY